MTERHFVRRRPPSRRTTHRRLRRDSDGLPALDGRRTRRPARCTPGSGSARWSRGPGAGARALVRGELSTWSRGGDPADPEGATLLRPGDYGLIPVGVPHAWRNLSDAAGAVGARCSRPQPRPRFDGDTDARAGAAGDDRRSPIDARDPRTRRFGHIAPANMDVAKQSQENLLSLASMRTALLVYSGITVKMMVDSRPGRGADHDVHGALRPRTGWPGRTTTRSRRPTCSSRARPRACSTASATELGPGDVAFAGVGCVHGFRNLGGGPLRWLETQAPQPPGRALLPVRAGTGSTCRTATLKENQ